MSEHYQRERFEIRYFNNLYDKPSVVPQIAPVRMQRLRAFRNEIASAPANPDPRNQAKLITRLDKSIQRIAEEFELGADFGEKDIEIVSLPLHEDRDEIRNYALESEFSERFVGDFYGNDGWQAHEKRREGSWRGKRVPRKLRNLKE
jgi:hypothetical protein